MKKLILALPLLLTLAGCQGRYKTTPIYVGGNLDITRWVAADGFYCGTVLRKSDVWNAYAYDDYSRDHYFYTRDEAVKWLTDNWCKP